MGVTVNPLGLPVEWRGSVTPLHGPENESRLAGLVASMTQTGWSGPPIVADRELRDANQDRAYTGSHRLEAWSIVCDERGAAVPCVYIEDLCEALGFSWDALMVKHEGDGYEAASELCLELPGPIREAYGLDLGGW